MDFWLQLLLICVASAILVSPICYMLHRLDEEKISAPEWIIENDGLYPYIFQTKHKEWFGNSILYMAVGSHKSRAEAEADIAGRAS